MKLLVFGPQGSGKGTYASRLSSMLDNIPHISTGDIFREAIKSGTPLGKKIQSYVNSGALVPDSIVIEVLNERFLKSDAGSGWILDGFPRTREQALALDDLTDIDAVINLMVPEHVLISRISTRRVCANCGAIYNPGTGILPKKPGICDKCSGPLIQRDDDKPEAIKKRLALYRSQTEPLLNHYAASGKLLNVEWNERDIPPGKTDVPPEIMVEKIMLKLRTLKKTGGNLK